ncbi:single-stranded-DNA-specific exonuclease RecJ [Planctomycetota bacterium]|nr:single-stranded-DNA-specific exonuclease RecJ [Planctomycetota bacterium]
MTPEFGFKSTWTPRPLTNTTDPSAQPDAQIDNIDPDEFAQQIHQHPLIAKLLLSRKITEADKALSFLTPKLTDLHDPSLIPGATQAAKRISQAVNDNQPIVIYGDYDVDGVTASTILFHTLDLAKANVSCYIPHRLDEGYGLNSEALKHIASCNWYSDPENKINNGQPADPTVAPLIITVDCGITACEQATLAKELGVDLIITDHHHFDADNLPDAHTLVHPRIPSDQEAYPFGDLCGAGVAFKLAWQFARLHHNLNEESGALPDVFKKLMVDLLSLVALGTVADVVPLVGENRALTIYGLGRIKNTPFTGLNALIDSSKLRDEKVDAYHVGFVLGPRLNASGRMGHARNALYLLTVAQEKQARHIADFLTVENQKRKDTERDIVQQAKKMIDELGLASPDKRAIVVGDAEWHKGVVGIVASRLVEAYHRPAVVLSYEEDGSASGSARSFGGVDIHAAFTAAGEHLTKFGGHEAAAGCTLQQENVDAFRDALINHCNDALAEDELVSTLKIDAEIEFKDIQLQLFQTIQTLAPFGNANPKPKLVLRNVVLDRPPQRIGSEGAHLSINIRHGEKCKRAVGFGLGELAEKLAVGMHLDLVFSPAINNWQNRLSPDMHVLDIKIATPAAATT